MLKALFLSATILVNMTACGDGYNPIVAKINPNVTAFADKVCSPFDGVMNFNVGEYVDKNYGLSIVVRCKGGPTIQTRVPLDEYNKGQ